MMIAVIVGISFAANAQVSKQEDKKEKTEMKQAKLKDHVCTAACKEGKHVYAHGEKGHVCGDDCKKAMKKDAALKDHVCTAACKNGTHVYAHGEKGHVCGPACGKM